MSSRALNNCWRKSDWPDEEIIIRMTGCPNGCARPYTAELAFVGRAPGKYQLYLGGNESSTRLGRLYKESVKNEDLVGGIASLVHAVRQGASRRGTVWRFLPARAPARNGRRERANRASYQFLAQSQGLPWQASVITVREVSGLNGQFARAKLRRNPGLGRAAFWAARQPSAPVFRGRDSS